jgi:hypothetical protein
MDGESVEMMFPEASVWIKPLSRGAHRARCQTHVPHSSLAAALDESRSLEHGEVLANSW